RPGRTSARESALPVTSDAAEGSGAGERQEKCPMSKALWKGQLSLGLVHIPIRLYPETRPRAPAFTLVDRRDLAPIGVRHVNKRTGEPVPASDIARAATLPGGEKVIVPDHVLDELAGEGTRSIR